MSRPAVPPDEEPSQLTDPWATAPASWVPFPGTHAARAKAQQFLKPSLWEYIVRPADRALVAQLAGEVLEAEPAVGHAFAGRLLERLRARGAAATSDAERQRVHALDSLVSANLSNTFDLLTRLRGLRVEGRS